MDDVDTALAHEFGMRIIAARAANMRDPLSEMSDEHLDKLAELGVRAARAMAAALPRMQEHEKAEADAAAEAEAVADAERQREAEQAKADAEEFARQKALADEAAAKEAAALEEAHQRETEEAARQKALADHAEMEAAAHRERAGMTPEGAPDQEAHVHAAGEATNAGGGELTGSSG